MLQSGAKRNAIFGGVFAGGSLKGPKEHLHVFVFLFFFCGGGGGVILKTDTARLGGGQKNANLMGIPGSVCLGVGQTQWERWISATPG